MTRSSSGCSKAGATALVLDPGTPTDEVLAHAGRVDSRGPGLRRLLAARRSTTRATSPATTSPPGTRRSAAGSRRSTPTMRQLWDDDAFLVSATRLGGYHGY